MGWMQDERRRTDVRTAAGVQLVPALLATLLVAGPLWGKAAFLGALAPGELWLTLSAVPGLWLLPVALVQLALSAAALMWPRRRWPVDVVAVTNVVMPMLGGWYGPTTAVVAVGVARGWHRVLAHHGLVRTTSST